MFVGGEEAADKTSVVLTINPNTAPIKIVIKSRHWICDINRNFTAAFIYK